MPFFFSPLQSYNVGISLGSNSKLKLCCLQFLQNKIRISIHVLLCPEELNLLPTYSEQAANTQFSSFCFVWKSKLQ